MSEQLVNQAALEIFRVHGKIQGLDKSEADERWRALGPEGRKEWRNMAAAALRVFGGEAEALVDSARPAAVAQPENVARAEPRIRRKAR